MVNIKERLYGGKIKKAIRGSKQLRRGAMVMAVQFVTELPRKRF